jgi:hypothetical protein
MVARTASTALLASFLLLMVGCGGGGNDFFSQQNGAGGGAGSLDIAGTYSAVPDTFGFNMLTIYQNGNNLSATDNGGGTWAGNLSNIIIEEASGPGGTTVMTWRADVNLNGKNAVGDTLALRGAVEITTSASGNVVLITADYENTSIGLTGQLLLTRISAMPGGATGAGGGSGGSSGAGNK